MQEMRNKRAVRNTENKQQSDIGKYDNINDVKREHTNTTVKGRDCHTGQNYQSNYMLSIRDTLQIQNAIRYKVKERKSLSCKH